MNRPDLFRLPSWEQHEDNLLEIFQAALLRLAGDGALPKTVLFFYARKENYRLRGQERGTPFPIHPDVNNPPLKSDEDRDKAKRESKHPDFMCVFVDHIAGLDRFFAVECKRLGEPPSETWILNRNYVIILL